MVKQVIAGTEQTLGITGGISLLYQKVPPPYQPQKQSTLGVAGPTLGEGGSPI